MGPLRSSVLAVVAIINLILLNRVTAVVWGPCTPLSGDCGRGKETSDELVMVGGMGITNRTRPCELPCAGVPDEEEMEFEEPEAEALYADPTIEYPTELPTSSCPDGTTEAHCPYDPCDFMKCTNYPLSLCSPDFCGGCRARFYDADENVIEHCDGQCAYGQQFNKCGSACTRTCYDPNPICTQQCIPQCECPASAPILHENTCITLDQCPGQKHVCPDGSHEIECAVNPCDIVKCTNFPFAVCRPDYCGGCRARFYDEEDNLIEHCQGNCPAGQEFHECGSACTQTCDEPHPVCTLNCVPRCECPFDAPILHDNRCISILECPVGPGMGEISAGDDDVMPACTGNLTTLVYEECNVTCGEGYEVVWVFQDGMMCEERTQVCVRKPCSEGEKDDMTSASAVRLEKMTDCEGQCEPGETTSLGVMKFMKFCGEAPCGISNEMCTIECNPGNITDDGRWSECSARCGDGTQSRIDTVTGDVVTRSCTGTHCEVEEEVMHENDDDEEEWGICQTITGCEVGVQFKACNACVASRDVRLCTNEEHQCRADAAEVWSDWTQCKCSVEDNPVSTRTQINCEPGKDCKQETRQCDCSSEDENYGILKSAIVGGDLDYTVAAGSSLQLTCYAVSRREEMMSDRELELRWITIDADADIELEESVHVKFVDGFQIIYNVLSIPELTGAHSASYMCRAECNQQTRSHVVTLNVLHFVHNLSDEHVNEGEIVQLTCEVNNPGNNRIITETSQISDDSPIEASSSATQIYITWLKDNHVLFPLLYTREPYSGVLTLFRVEKRDEGKYQCQIRYGDITLESSVSHVTVNNQEGLSARHVYSDGLPDWSAWSECSTHCELGFMVRGRALSDTVTENEVMKCVSLEKGEGHPSGNMLLSVEYSPESKHMSVLSHWSTWGTCDRQTCMRNRTRECLTAGCDTNIPLLEPDFCETCDAASGSPFDVTKRSGMIQTGRFSACSTLCGFGVTVRPSYCSDCNDKIMFDVDSCLNELKCDRSQNYDVLTDVTLFATPESVSIVSQWAEWSACDCDTRTKRRTRETLAVECVNSADNCDDSAIGRLEEQSSCDDSTECDMQKEEENFTSWSEWGNCVPKCGKGRRYRTRSCTGFMCKGRLSDSIPCETKCDLGDEYFTQWGAWSGCDGNTGYRQRIRSCLDELNCPKTRSLTLEVDYCEQDHIEDLYTDWGEWSSCVGTQFKIRRRTCLDPSNCPHDVMDVGECEKMKEVDDYYNDWGEWSSCQNSVFKHRTRSCRDVQDCPNQTAQVNDVEMCEEREKKPEQEEKEETEEKTTEEEENVDIEDYYTEWGDWSTCEGREFKHRTRACKDVQDCPNETAHLNDVEMCGGEGGREEEDRFSEWSEWTDCGGQNYKHRSRSCKEGHDCSDSNAQTQDIDYCSPEDSEDPDDLFTEWTAWSECIGGSYIHRSRTCKAGRDCSESGEITREVDYCSSSQDEEIQLGRWVNWGSCQVGGSQCGDGTQMQVRQCQLDEPKTCPIESEKTTECDEDTFFECTKIYRLVPCSIVCEEEMGEIRAPQRSKWTRDGSCVLQEADLKCGKGKIFEYRTCFMKGTCSMEDLGCADRSDFRNCDSIVRLADCEVPCNTASQGWKKVTQDCDTASCAIPVDLSTHYIEMKYSATENFYGAIEFIGDEGGIGYLAWGFKGFYIDACEKIRKFSTITVPESKQREEMLWTLYITDKEILLVAEDVLHFREKIETCPASYAASKIKAVGFRNLMARGASYNFAEKGEVGDWVDVGPCMMETECGAGRQVQRRACLESGTCPKLLSFLGECDADNFLECAELFRTRKCAAECGLFISKRNINPIPRSPGKLVEYMSGGCHFPYPNTCGSGEMVMVYSCFYDNSCPTEYYKYEEHCDAEDFFHCNKLFHIVPCYAECEPSTAQEDLGRWEDVGDCEPLGPQSGCGEYEGTQLQVRSCVNTKTCKRKTTIEECSDPWHCSDFYRTVPCTVSCDNHLGDWVDMWEDECIPNEGICGPGTLTQVRSCHLDRTCPKWASSTLLCDSDLTVCSPLFRGVDCHVQCDHNDVYDEEAEAMDWLPIRDCMMSSTSEEECGDGHIIMNHRCVDEGDCGEVFGCTTDICPEAVRAEPCSIPCESKRDLGELVSFGGCMAEDGAECGPGEDVHVYSCYFDETCPDELNKTNCPMFLNCPELYVVKECHVTCQDPLGDWVPHGECHPVQMSPTHESCGPEAGTQLLVRECLQQKTCPRDSHERCSRLLDMGCSDLVTLGTCDVPCSDPHVIDTDRLLGTWVDIYKCIPEEHCGVGSIPQMRSCMNARNCPKWSMEHPSCFDHFNCTTLFREKVCFEVCPEESDEDGGLTPSDETPDDVIVPTTIPPREESESEEDEDKKPLPTDALPDNAILPTTPSPTPENGTINDRLKRQVTDMQAHSCEDLLRISTDFPSGVYTLVDKKGDSYETYCKMTERNYEPLSWTLVASFVNTDRVVSWGKGNLTNWRNSKTFGNPGKSQDADYKGPAWSEVAGNEILVEDRFGQMTFYMGKQKRTLHDIIMQFTACTHEPVVGPGDHVDSSSVPWRTHGALLVYPEKSIGAGCALNEGGKDKVPVLGFGGTRCGLMGAGMANSYSLETMDWHMSMDMQTTCTTARCDKSRCSGPWNGNVLASSTENPNHKGVHDASTWGRLYIK